MNIGHFFKAFTITFVLFVNSAYATPWNLPTDITNENTKVTFEVDSTWHLIEGSVKQISGRVWLQDELDDRSIKAKINFPIASFDTGNSSRDEELRKVMHAQQIPDVQLELNNIALAACSLSALEKSTVCQQEILGELTINNVKKNVPLHTTFTKQGDDYIIAGTTELRWEDYGVDDPSILVAKVYPSVKINFSVNLVKQKASTNVQHP